MEIGFNPDSIFEDDQNRTIEKLKKMPIPNCEETIKGDHKTKIFEDAVWRSDLGTFFTHLAYITYALPYVDTEWDSVSSKMHDISFQIKQAFIKKYPNHLIEYPKVLPHVLEEEKKEEEGEEFIEKTNKPYKVQYFDENKIVIRPYCGKYNLDKKARVRYRKLPSGLIENFTFDMVSEVCPNKKKEKEKDECTDNSDESFIPKKKRKTGRKMNISIKRLDSIEICKNCNDPIGLKDKYCDNCEVQIKRCQNVCCSKYKNVCGNICVECGKKGGM